MLLNKIPQNSFTLEGINYLFFSGTGYLGASSHPEFKNQLIKSVKKWGGSYGSSRHANIKLSIYNKGEAFLAKLLHKEAALTVSSGTLAGKLAINTLEKYNDAFFYMPNTHPVIKKTNCKPVFVNNNLNPLLIHNKFKNIVICADAIPILSTHPFCFDFIKKIPNNKHITLLLDESHSLGVLGIKGGGISTTTAFPKNVEIVVISSLGKAYGICGGVIASKKHFINKIENNSLFVGAAGMSPAFLDCFISSQDFYMKQLLKLKDNLNYLAKHLDSKLKITFSKNYPIIYFEEANIAVFLQKEKILITHFTYLQSCDIKNKISKVIINANHTYEELNILLRVLNKLQF